MPEVVILALKFQGCVLDVVEQQVEAVPGVCLLQLSLLAAQMTVEVNYSPQGGEKMSTVLASLAVRVMGRSSTCVETQRFDRWPRAY